MATALPVEVAEVCYICYEEASASKPFCDQTCECKGSLRIHTVCLFELRRGATRASVCTICKYPYKPYTPGHLVHTAGPHNLTYVEYVNAQNIRLEYTITSDGKTHGIMHGYYSSGRKHSVAHYLYGELHGPFQRFEDNPTNTLLEHLYYQANERHGCAQQYFSGQECTFLQKIFHYKYGKLEGVAYEYNMQGIIVREYNYKGGQLDGAYKEFDDAGMCKKHFIYANGKLKKTLVAY